MKQNKKGEGKTTITVKPKSGFVVCEQRKGYKTADIAEFLSMSRVTVIRHRNKWFSNNRSFMIMLNKLKKRRSVKKIWNTLEDILYPLDVILKSRTNMKARAKLYSGDFKRDRNE